MVVELDFEDDVVVAQTEKELLTREEWLQVRKYGLGGSDIAAILGLSKWRTPLDVYLDKIGESEETSDNDAMLFGRLLEPVLLQHYFDITGEAQRIMPQIIRHVDHDWMLASVDGATKSDRIIEIKTARSTDGWGEIGTDEIPEYYTTQVQWYLSITGYEVADVAVLIGGSDFRIYTVYADYEIQQILIDKASEFWQRVIDRNPPEPINDDDIVKIFPKNLKAPVEGTTDIFDTVGRLASINQDIKSLESTADKLKEEIKLFIKDHDGITMDDKPIVTWKAAKDSIKTDWEKAFIKLAEITSTDKGWLNSFIKQFQKTQPGSRRLLLK